MKSIDGGSLGGTISGIAAPLEPRVNPVFGSLGVRRTRKRVERARSRSRKASPKI